MPAERPPGTQSHDAFFAEADPDTFLVAGDAARYAAGAPTQRKEALLLDWARAPKPVQPPKDAPAPYPGPTDLDVDPHSFEAMWGMPMPVDLRAYRDLLRAGAPPLREWRPALVLFGAPESDGFNVVEWMIHRNQRVARLLCTELFAGLVLLGSSYGGDTYHYGLFDRQCGASDNRVWHFDHEIDAVDGAIADNLSTLLYAATVLEAHAEARTVTAPGLAAAFAKLRQKVALPVQFEDDLESAGLDETEFGAQFAATAGHHFFGRAAWLEHLLRDDGGAIGSVKHVFFEDLNPVVSDAEHARRVEAVPVEVPTALYALFRAFFFDEGQRLNDYVSAAQRSRSRIIRDAGHLVRELAEGRKQLGTITDAQALREELRALDLDPAQAESRAVRRRAHEEDLRRRAADNHATVRGALLRETDLVELAWAHLDDPDMHARILDAWRTDPSMSRALAALDGIDGDGYKRDGSRLDNELEEASLFLAGERYAAERLVPLLVGRLRRREKTWHVQPIMVAITRSGIPGPVRDRATVALRPLLERAEQDYAAPGDVASILGLLEDAGAVDGLSRLVSAYVAAPMKGVVMAKMARDALGALKRIGDPRGADAARHALANCKNPADSDAAADALGVCGRQDVEATVAVLLSRLAAEGPLFEPSVPWALASLVDTVVTGAGPEVTRALLRLRAGISDPTRRVVLEGALARLGAENEAPELVARALDPADRVAPASEHWPWYGGEKTHARRIWALRVLGTLPVIPAALAQPWTRVDAHDVRRAAIAALHERGVPAPPVHPYYRFILDDLFAEGGVAALHTALADPAGIFKTNVALKLGELAVPESVPHLVAHIRRIVGAYDPSVGSDTPDDLRWAVKALLAFGPERYDPSVLLELLAHPDRRVKDPVLRDPPPDPRLVPGMRHVRKEKWAWQAKAAAAWLAKYEGTQE
jgi:hypothetical protein